MYISKLSKSLCILLLCHLTVIPTRKAVASDILYHIGADFMPMVSVSWDKIMGWNVGIGASSGTDIYIGMTGPYVYTNFSLQKPGISISSGHYITIAGMVSMRNGGTFMMVRDPKVGGAYLGLENSMTVSPLLGGYEIAPLNLIGGYYRVSGLKRFGHKGLTFNGAVGLGVF